MTALRLAIVSLLAALALVVSACGGGDEEVPRDAIAVVDGREIPKAEFDQLMRQAERSYKQQKRPFPKAGTPDYRTLKNNAVQFLVERLQFRLAAEELGVEVTEDEIDKRLQELKKQYFNGNEKRYQAALRQQGMTEEQMRETVRDQLVQQGVYDKLTEDVEVSANEIERYYREHRGQFGTPASREVRHILVSVCGEQKTPGCLTQAKARQQAQQLRQRLQDGESFTKLAKRYSKDPGSAANGGKLTISRGQTVPPFERAAFNLSVGELSQPVKTDFGFHLIEPLTPVKPATTRPLQEVREQIRQQLLQEKRNEAVEEWVEKTKEQYADETRYQVGFAPPPASTTTTATR